MKTAILLTSVIIALPLAGMAQPDERQAGRDEAPPRQGWRGGDDDEFRGPAGPRGPGFRGEFGPGPRAGWGERAEAAPRAGLRRCPNCHWSPADGPPRGQGAGRGRDLPPPQFRRGPGGPPEWAPREGDLPERPGYGPRARREEEDAPPFRGRGPREDRPDRDEEE